MTTYNLNIDIANTSLTYFQAEKHIYGSSRLGMLKDSVNVLGSAYGDTDSLNVTHKLGNKRYELSNHLGNVLAVLTDKPIPHNNGGTVDYWEANISSAYDYSPFGVMLTGRTFEGKETICHDSTVQATQNTLEEGFGSWGSWMPTNNCGITYVTDTMKISNQKSTLASIGADITFTTGLGAHYVSFNIVGINWGDPIFNQIKNITVVIRDNNNNVIINENYSAIGSYNLSFTPTVSGVTYRLHIFNRNASVNAMFELDDVLISYEDETIVTDCREVDAGYRYGYQGSEMDNEVKGKGNSYTTFFRQLDPRLGRWLTIDPKISSRPWESPYSSMGNNPVGRNDIMGDKWKDKKDKETGDAAITEAKDKITSLEKDYEKYLNNAEQAIKNEDWNSADMNMDKMSEATKGIGVLSALVKDIERMGSEKEEMVFHFNDLGQDPGTDPEKGSISWEGEGWSSKDGLKQININYFSRSINGYNLNDNKFHELGHAGDVLNNILTPAVGSDKDDFKPSRQTDPNGLILKTMKSLTIESEIKAFNIQYFISNSKNSLKIKSSKEIDLQFLIKRGYVFK